METITQQSLTQAEWGIYEKWYGQVRLSLDEEQAKHNTVLILTNLKNIGYTVTSENLTRVLQRLYTLPKTTIYNQPEQAPADARATQHINKDFSNSGWNDQTQLQTDQKQGPSQDLYVNGKLNHARLEKKESAPVPTLTKSDEKWLELANAIRANTHSHTAQIQAIHGDTPRETYELRKKKQSELTR